LKLTAAALCHKRDASERHGWTISLLLFICQQVCAPGGKRADIKVSCLAKVVRVSEKRERESEVEKALAVAFLVFFEGKNQLSVHARIPLCLKDC
jgi:hypothetical protein